MERDRSLTAKDKLERAFFDLLEEKHYSKIAVSELIEKAGVSRTTFYRHYDDIFDMYKKVCEHMIEAFMKKMIIKIAFEAKLTKAIQLFDMLIEMLASQKKYILLLSGKHGNRYFYERILSFVYENLDILPFKLSQEEIFKLKFVMFAGVSSYLNSVLNDTKISKDILTISNDILNFSGLEIDIEGI